MWGRLFAALQHTKQAARNVDGFFSSLNDGGRPGLRSHCLALLSILLSFALVAAVIVSGWLLLWHFAMKDVNLFRELLGLNRQQSLKAKQDAAAEILLLKKKFNRSRSSSARSD